MWCFTKFHLAVFASTIGSFQHGYQSGVVNIPAAVFTEWIRSIVSTRMDGAEPSHLKIQLLWSTIMSMFSVGGIFGGLLSGFVADKFGRKRSILWNNVTAIFAFVILGYTKKTYLYEIFMIGRFIAGFNAGINLGVCQMYLIEIAPNRIRGAVGSAYHMVALTSVLVANLVSVGLGTKEYWNLIFFMSAIPCLAQLFTFPFCPETPKYLILSQGLEIEAETALVWLRGTPDVRKEMDALKEEDILLKEMNYISLKRLGADPIFRTPLVVCMVLNMAQEFCGINALLYFSYQIFQNIGMVDMEAKFFTMALILVGAVATSLAITFVDKAGRRVFLRIGFMGLAIDTLGLTITLILADDPTNPEYIKCLAFGFIFVFMVIYSCTLGPIPWFITAEIFCHTARGLAVSLAVASNWLANFIISQSFLTLQDTIGYYIFIPFLVLDCIFCVFIQLFLPETTRLSAKKIMQLYI